MKKRLIQIALILGLMALTCAAAQASETEADEPVSGFRVVAVESAYENDVALTPIDDKGANVAQADVRYPGAVKMKISYANAQTGNEYLLCVLADDESGVPTVDNMAYIDQKTADGAAVEFTAFPKAVDSKTTSVKYAVYLSSDADAASANGSVASFTKVASFEYYFAGLNVMLGDVDGDEDITVNDALDALFLSVGTLNNTERPEEEQRTAADVNEDGDVGVDDALNILYCSVGTKTGIQALDGYIDNQ